jgi:hypothetical protein
MRIKQYLEKDLKILASDKYLQLEKVLTKRANKKEVNVHNDNFLSDVTFNLINNNDRNKQSHYEAIIPLVRPDTKPKTMEEFIKQCEKDPYYPYSIRQNCNFGVWEAYYKFSINFIALFLDECVNSSFSKNPDEDFCIIFSDPEKKFIEDLKILKYFLAEIYEHAMEHGSMDQECLELNLFYFSAEKLGYISSRLSYALDLFHCLLLNGLVYSGPIRDFPRYRELYTFKSFDVLLNALKEHNKESAANLLTLISTDFLTFSYFISGARNKALSIESIFKNEFRSSWW